MPKYRGRGETGPPTTPPACARCACPCPPSPRRQPAAPRPLAAPRPPSSPSLRCSTIAARFAATQQPSPRPPVDADLLQASHTHEAVNAGLHEGDCARPPFVVL